MKTKAIKVWDNLSWDPAGKFMEGKDCVSFIFVPLTVSNSQQTFLLLK